MVNRIFTARPLVTELCGGRILCVRERGGGEREREREKACEHRDMLVSVQLGCACTCMCLRLDEGKGLFCRSSPNRYVGRAVSLEA